MASFLFAQEAQSLVRGSRRGHHIRDLVVAHAVGRSLGAGSLVGVLAGGPRGVSGGHSRPWRDLGPGLVLWVSYRQCPNFPSL